MYSLMKLLLVLGSVVAYEVQGYDEALSAIGHAPQIHFIEQDDPVTVTSPTRESSAADVVPPQ